MEGKERKGVRQESIGKKEGCTVRKKGQRKGNKVRARKKSAKR